jgi:anti-sigma regulatory factor (Ser/Thr protein kinase)
VEGDLDVVDTWLGGEQGIPLIDEASVSLVRERVREQGARAGLGTVATAALASAASELGHNQLRHAHAGVVVVRSCLRGDEVGVEVVAADRGPGIADVAGALEGRPSHPGSLGAGLAAVLELSDEVDIDVRLGEGTCIWARKFEVSGGPRRPRVGIFGRPYPGERVSGDDAGFIRTSEVLQVGVIDGLGHGDPARDASVRAARALATAGDVAPEALVADCDRLLARTRGAVMVAARLDLARSLRVAGVGNVAAHVYGHGPSWRFGGSSFVLGSPGGARRIALEVHYLDSRDVLLLFTDGIRSRIDLTGELDLLREHPVVVAQRVVERFARADDDVLVMAVG